MNAVERLKSVRSISEMKTEECIELRTLSSTGEVVAARDIDEWEREGERGEGHLTVLRRRRPRKNAQLKAGTVGQQAQLALEPHTPADFRWAGVSCEGFTCVFTYPCPLMSLDLLRQPLLPTSK